MESSVIQVMFKFFSAFLCMCFFNCTHLFEFFEGVHTSYSCFLVMDNENLPMQRSTSDTTASTPQVASRSSEYNDKLAIPSLQVAMLQDVRKDISALTGIVKQFVEYNVNRDKSLDSSFTMVRPDERSNSEPFTLTSCKRRVLKK